jgi:hypothetical protein
MFRRSGHRFAEKNMRQNQFGFIALAAARAGT